MKASILSAAVLGVVIASLAAHVTLAQESPAPPAATGAPAIETITLLPAIFANGKETDLTKGLRENTVDPINKGSMPLADKQSPFDNYYKRYVFAKMTQTSDAWLARLPVERKQLIKDHIRQSAVHDHLVGLTFTAMKDIAAKNYHPAVRHNAMQIIADLNQKEAAAGTSNPPEAYTPALAFMVDQIADPKQLDSVRIAAALGVIRHAELDIARASQTPPLPQMPVATRSAMIAKLLPVVADKSTHYWLRARVLEALTALTQPAPDDKVVTALVAAVGDDKEPPLLRLVASASLGRLNLATATASGKDIARDLAKLSVESSQPLLLKLEAQIAADKIRGGSPTGANDPRREEKLTMTRSALRNNMEEVKRGLQGWDNRADDKSKLGAFSAAKKDQAYYDNVVKDVKQLITVAETPKPKIEDLARDMRAPLNSLKALVQQAGGRVAPPAGVPTEVTPTTPAAPAEVTPATAPVAAPAPMPPAAATPTAAAAAKKAP